MCIAAQAQEESTALHLVATRQLQKGPQCCWGQWQCSSLREMERRQVGEWVGDWVVGLQASSSWGAKWRSRVGGWPCGMAPASAQGKSCCAFFGSTAAARGGAVWPGAVAMQQHGRARNGERQGEWPGHARQGSQHALLALPAPWPRWAGWKPAEGSGGPWPCRFDLIICTFCPTVPDRRNM